MTGAGDPDGRLNTAGSSGAAATTGSTERTGSTAFGRFVQHLRDPMQRSGYALMLGSAANSGFGFLFWVVAARLFESDVVGTATALIAAMGFVATAATLGLRGSLIRFLPVAGSGAVRLVQRSYAVCGLAAAAGAAVFVLGQGLWAEDLGLLRDTTLASVAFVGATVVWVGTILQEYVLIGLRRATWVPVAGVSYSLLKILLLVTLPMASAWAVFAAYTAPALVVFVLVNALVLRLAARPAMPDAPAPELPSLKGLARFAVGDHTAAMLWLATTELLPLLVLAQAGASASAYYYLAFTIGYSLYLITSSIGNALVAEGAIHPDRVPELTRRATLNALRLVVPAVAVGVLGAPLVLRLLGPEYENEATGLLQLLVLSAVPQVVVGIAVSVAKLRRDVGRLIAVYLALAVLVYVGCYVALRTVGLVGVGAAWLVGQTVVAAVLLATYLSFLWKGQVHDTFARSASSARKELLKVARRREVKHLAGRLAAVCGAELTELSLVTSSNDVVVFVAVMDGRGVVVKVSRSTESSGSVSRHGRAVREVAARAVDARAPWPLPAVLHHGELDGKAYVVEERLPGHRMQRDGVPARAVPTEAGTAARKFDEIHRATAHTLQRGEQAVEYLVHEPLRALAGLPDGVRTVAELAGLRDVLVRALTARRLTVSWTHGDCGLGNVLGIADGSATVVTGLVGWEDARPDGLPDLDLAHLWLTSQGGEIGERLIAAVADGGGGFVTWLAENGITRSNEHLDTRLVLALAWLAHVQTGIRRNPPAGPGRVWRLRNVEAVARRLCQMYGQPGSSAVDA